MAWIEARSELPRRDLHEEFVETFGRGDVSLDAIKQLCTRRGWKTGRTGCFPKGSVPVNKGKRCPDGTGGRHPNSRKTQFRKGERTGVAVKLYKPIGAERISKGGYRERKIHDGLPLQSRWRAVHLIEWEALNGSIPPGHCLKSIDGNRANADPSNWKCIPRSLLPRLAGRWTLPYDSAPAELKPVILAAAQLRHTAKRARSAAKSQA